MNNQNIDNQPKIRKESKNKIKVDFERTPLKERLKAKFLNLFLKNKINPMIGAAGISAFPMASRVVQKLGQKEDNQNFLLMHAAGANVAGQIASVIAGGLILNIIPMLIR